eukprot:2893033-Karenia_brevis.AAC.1
MQFAYCPLPFGLERAVRGPYNVKEGFLGQDNQEQIFLEYEAKATVRPMRRSRGITEPMKELVIHGNSEYIEDAVAMAWELIGQNALNETKPIQKGMRPRKVLKTGDATWEAPGKWQPQAHEITAKSAPSHPERAQIPQYVNAVPIRLAEMLKQDDSGAPTLQPGMPGQVDIPKLIIPQAVQGEMEWWWKVDNSKAGRQWWEPDNRPMMHKNMDGSPITSGGASSSGDTKPIMVTPLASAGASSSGGTQPSMVTPSAGASSTADTQPMMVTPSASAGASSSADAQPIMVTPSAGASSTADTQPMMVVPVTAAPDGTKMIAKDVTKPIKLTPVKDVADGSTQTTDHNDVHWELKKEERRMPPALHMLFLMF